MSTSRILVAACCLALLGCPEVPPASCKCAAGETCLAGQCLPVACGEGQCRKGQGCKEGQCRDQACLETSCPSGQRCASGACYPIECEVVSCSAGDVCAEGHCTAGTCMGLTCSTGEVCADGRCVPQACEGVVCADGTGCVDGRCVQVACVGVVCETGTACLEGTCIPGACGATSCPKGWGCLDGACVDPGCVTTGCPSGSTCEEGRCVACAAAEEACGDGEDEDCDSRTDCADPDCEAAACAAPSPCGQHLCAAGTCDVVWAPFKTVCRAAAGPCEADALCSGASLDCPPNERLSPVTECRASAGPCEAPAFCSGDAAECPANLLLGPATVCRPAAGACDLAESCDGTGPHCPADAFQPATFECNPGNGPCRRARFCPGDSAACPPSLGRLDFVVAGARRPALPASAGETTTDESFLGVTVMRLTDADDGPDCTTTEYRVRLTFNADGTRALVHCGDCTALLLGFDPVAFARVPGRTLLPAVDGEGRAICWREASWSGQDPDALFIHTNRVLERYDVAQERFTVLFDLTAQVGDGFVRALTKDAQDEYFAFERVDSAWLPAGHLLLKMSPVPTVVRNDAAVKGEPLVDRAGTLLALYTAGTPLRVDGLGAPSAPQVLSEEAPVLSPRFPELGDGSIVGWSGVANVINHRTASDLLSPRTLLDLGADWESSWIFSAYADDQRWVLAVSNLESTYSSGLFHDELVLLPTGGSGGWRRVGRHHNAYGDWRDVARANLSKDGCFAAFPSNWGTAGGRHDVFVLRLY